MRLFLIRHGETDWSIEKRYCGFSNIALNNKGIAQAERLYHRISSEKIDKVYSSDSKRALDFAAIVFRGFSIERSVELREMNFGIFEGLTHEELVKRYTEVYIRWIEKPLCITIPNGEAVTSFRKRIEDIFAKIVSIEKDKVAVVTHGGPIKLLIGNILGLEDSRTLNPDLASISIVDFKNDKKEILLFNDTSYLNG